MIPRIRDIAVGLALILALAAGAAPGRGVGTEAPPKDPAARKALEKKLIATISGDAEFIDKHKACRRLRTVGSPACVPALAKLLDDEKLSHMARYALEPMSCPEAGRALRDALASTTGARRIGVIASVGFRRDGKATAALVKLLAADEATASAAAAALGRIADADALAALKDLRAPAEGALAAAAARASLTAAQRLIAAGELDAAAGIYTDLGSANQPDHIRRGAFVGLLAAEPDKAPARVVEALGSDDATLRAVAIDRIASIDAPGSGKQFAGKLPALEPDVQVLLIGALAGRRDPAVRQAVTAAAGSEVPAVRTAAVRTLGTVGDASTAAVLCKAAAAGQTRQEKLAAAASLRALDADGVNEALLAHLKRAPAAERPAVMQALVERSVPDATADLLGEARAEDAGVRAAAFKALGSLAAPKDLPTLVSFLLRQDDPAARTQAERAVVLVARKVTPPAERSGAVLAALKSVKEPERKASLLRVLGGIADAAALEAVRTAAGAEDEAVRDAAVRALADWPAPAAVDALLEVIADTESTTHRVLALRGAVRLLGGGDVPAEEALASYRRLLEIAARPADKRLVLAGVAKLAHPGAAELVEPLLGDGAVGSEAELALLGIAEGLATTAPEEARALAEKLDARSRSAKVRKGAATVIDRVEKFEDYLVAWQLAGPYRGRFGGLLSKKFPPEKRAGKGVEWRKIAAGGDPEKPFMVDLAGALGEASAAAYARGFVHVGDLQPARLELGADDGSKVWLNGKQVHADGEGGAAEPGEHKISVTLRAGWNELLVKITQDKGPWEFCLRIRTPDGGGIEGLRTSAAPPASHAKR